MGERKLRALTLMMSDVLYASQCSLEMIFREQSGLQINIVQGSRYICKDEGMDLADVRIVSTKTRNPFIKHHLFIKLIAKMGVSKRAYCITLSYPSEVSIHFLYDGKCYAQILGLDTKALVELNPNTAFPLLQQMHWKYQWHVGTPYNDYSDELFHLL
jgi:hypothetical protein